MVYASTFIIEIFTEHSACFQASVPGLLPQDVLRAALAGIDSQVGDSVYQKTTTKVCPFWL